MNLKTPLVFLNVGLFNYDKQLDLDMYANETSIVNATFHDSCVGLSDSEILKIIGSSEIIITKEMPLSVELVKALAVTARVIMEAGSGFNNLPIEALKEKGIKVCNVPAYSSRAVASLVLTHMMNYASGLIPQQLMLANNDRSNFFNKLSVPCYELEGKTIGLIGGGGKIGTCVKEAALALGMKVIISSRSSRESDHPSVIITSDLDHLFNNSDIISLHCPLTTDTFEIINFETLCKCRPTCHLINTARGGLINEEDLVRALEGGIIHSCALDVTVKEPLDSTSPLWSHPKVILTPHMGWRRLETRQRLVNMLWGNVQSWCESEGQSPANQVV